MAFRAAVFGTMAVFLMVSPAITDEVLYCTDTDATGFVWRNNTATTTNFNPDRFTVHVLSNEKRIVAEKSGSSYVLLCRTIDVDVITTGEGDLGCSDVLGTENWVFYRKYSNNTYTRSFLNGPPVGGSDPNIFVAYGTCTKF
jgi:hypothetical protein